MCCCSAMRFAASCTNRGLLCSSVSASLASSSPSLFFFLALCRHSIDFVSPKSAILTRFRSALSIRFPGLRSRWMRGGSFSCRYARPSIRSTLQPRMVCMLSPSASSFCARWSSRLPPSMSSMTMRRLLSLMQSPTNSTMLGCFRLLDSTRSSAVRPSSSSQSGPKSSRSFLIATALSGVLSSVPRNTSPMQPSPIFSPTVTSDALM
mmetsp:Transcript_29054/g.59003  ORF Transcript_29054/g.59003 Transcript_29054/m.59003 type:complete len:207 (-) Transcript_29054:111-731(-)